jgi:hypothetical protein
MADLALVHITEAHGLHITGWAADGSPLFDPPLSPAETETLADLRQMQRHRVSITLAEWQSIKADAAGLRAYLGVASPTAAQTAAATKAVIRVLSTVIRS